MKQVTSKVMLFLIATTGLFSSCERVAPNYYGVLMENYGKNGKSDYSKQQGKVNTISPGVELFQVPAWEQRAEFNEENGSKRILRLKASDNTEFNASPLYSYMVIKDKVIDVVFQNARLGSDDGFIKSMEDNVLEPLIYDIIKEESRKYNTDTLMATGGNLRFEQEVQSKIIKAFEEKGLQLITFSANLDFSEKVKQKIDTRNEVNTNISVLDQQITEQRKRNELAELQTQENIILSRGLTPEILRKMEIEAWAKYGCKVPIYYMGNGNLMVTAPSIK
jgi:hypothetical protein